MHCVCICFIPSFELLLPCYNVAIKTRKKRFAFIQETDTTGRSCPYPTETGKPCLSRIVTLRDVTTRRRVPGPPGREAGCQSCRFIKTGPFSPLFDLYTNSTKLISDEERRYGSKEVPETTQGCAKVTPLPRRTFACA